MFKRKVGAFMSKPNSAKSVFKIIALIVGVAAVAAGVSYAVTKFLKKKKTKKYYIECDCGEDQDSELDCVSDGQDAE